MSQITLKTMAYFEALSRHGNVAEAARSLSTSPKAFLRNISEFQQGAKHPLVVLDGDEATFTEKGQELAGRMRQVLQQTHDIQEFVSNQQPTLSGRFRLGIIPTIAPYLLPELLPKLKSEYPQLLLEIRETQTKALMEELLLGAVDALLVTLPVDREDVKVEPLFKDTLVLARRRGAEGDVPWIGLGADDIEPNGLDPRAVDPQGLILLEDGHCLREHAISHCGISPNLRMGPLGATSLPTVLELVSNGFGETLLPEMAVKVEARNPDLEIVHFQDPAPAREIGLVYRSSTAREQDVKAISQAIMEVRAAEVSTEAAE